MRGLRLALLAGFVAMALAAFGCDSGDSDGNGDACDPTCEVGFTCTDGACIQDALDCDPACGEGFTCTDGACVEDVVEGCDPACEGGFTCTDGACVEDVVEGCDPACEDGFTCVDDACVEDVVEGCDPACETGFTCIDAACAEDVVESEFDLLAAYLEGDMGDYINSSAPKIIGAADVVAEGLENWTIIDIRTADLYGYDENDNFVMGANEVVDFDDGHIPGANMVAYADIVTWAAENLTMDDKVLVTCYTGHTAGHAVLILNLLGYDAYSLKFGMSAWHSDFDMWSGKLGSDYTDVFVKTEAPAKPEKGAYPVLETGETDGAAILNQRIADLQDGGYAFTTATDVMAAPEDWFILNYWGEEDYLGMGHIDGAYQYTPKATLGTSTDLATLPTDMPIAVYCYSGQTGSQIAAYLTILGYDAYDLKFGTNGMIYDDMTSHKWAGAETGPANFDYEGMIEKTEFDILADYLEGDMGDYINTSAPKIIGAADVVAEGLENWTIVDIRTADLYGLDGEGDFVAGANGVVDFEEGHIPGANMVAYADIVTWAEANLTVDDKVLVTCYTGHTAGHAVLILNLLGYDAYSLKFGMSAWHEDFDLWSGKLSSNYSDVFVTTAAPAKPEKGAYPVLETGETTGAAILDQRIADLQAGGYAFTTATDVMAAPADWFILNYWGEADYLDMGHIDGAYQYTPKATLGTSTDLATLPTDMPIAVYCYSGQTGSQIAAYLTILGYDAYDLKFGTNGMIYDDMTSHKWAGAETGPAGYDYVTD